MDHLKDMTILRGALKFVYDNEGDVMYAYVNRPRRALSEEEGAIVFRIDYERKRLVGFTIVGFKYKMDNGIITNDIPYFGDVDFPDILELP